MARTRNSRQPQPIGTPASTALVLSTSESASTAIAILSKFRADIRSLYDKLEGLDTFATDCLSGPLPQSATVATLMNTHTTITWAPPDLSTFHSLQNTAYDRLLALPRTARDASAETEVDGAYADFSERKATVDAKMRAVWETLSDMVSGRANGEWQTPDQA